MRLNERIIQEQKRRSKKYKTQFRKYSERFFCGSRRSIWDRKLSILSKHTKYQVLTRILPRNGIFIIVNAQATVARILV